MRVRGLGETGVAGEVVAVAARAVEGDDQRQRRAGVGWDVQQHAVHALIAGGRRARRCRGRGRERRGRARGAACGEPENGEEEQQPRDDQTTESLGVGWRPCMSCRPVRRRRRRCRQCEWIVRPTAFLRRARARYGEPFTIRTAWSDAPLVLISDPQEIKRIYAAPPDVLQGGEAAGFLEPFVGRNSVLLLHGPEHARQRKLVMPAFHGEALQRWTDTIAQLAHEELDTWRPGRADEGAAEDAGADARGDPAGDLRQPRPRAAGRAADRPGPDGQHRQPDRDVARASGDRPVRTLHAGHAPDRRARVRAGRRGAGGGSGARQSGEACGARPRTVRPSSTRSSPRTRPARNCATSSSRCSRPATRRRRPRSPGRLNASPVTPSRSTPTSTSTRSSRRRCGPARCCRSPPARRFSPTSCRATSSRGASTSRRACTSRTAGRARPSILVASLRRHAGAVQLHPVRRWQPPVPGRGLRRAGDAGGAQGHRRAVRAQTHTAAGGAHAPPQRHPGPGARSGDHPGPASVRRRDVRHVLSP